MQKTLSPMKGPSQKDNEQFPVDPFHMTGIIFDPDGQAGDLLRLVITNDQSTERCDPQNEYQHGNTAVSIEDVSSFTMRSSSIAGTQQAVDAFVGEMQCFVNSPQAPSWTRGVHTPSAARKRLYKAVDPDDSTKMIGVLIEQDSAGQLVRLVWYKTTDAGNLFQSTPSELAFEIVRDERGAPSVDPNHIGGWTWYYTE